MKIIKAEVTGFGHYRQQQFEFLPGNQLLLGENEAGKSTLYQFIQAMLFGFPKKSPKQRDYTPTDGAAYGGKLWLEIQPYGEIRIERYRQIQRGQARVFLSDHEQEMDETFLQKLVAPLTKELFQNVYTFQQEQLTQLENLQENELHESLIALGISGSAQLQQRSQEAQKIQEQLFKPKARILPLNKELQVWQNLQQKILEKEAQEENVQAAYQQLTKNEHILEENQVQLEQTLQKQSHLKQQELHWSLYEEWQELQQQSPVSFSEEKTQTLRQFYQGYQLLAEEKQKKEAELAKIEQNQVSDRYFFYLDHENDIQQLLKQAVPWSRLTDEQQRNQQITRELSLKLQQFEHVWGWKTENPPAPFDPKIFDALAQLETLHEEVNQSQLRLTWEEEQLKEAPFQRTLSSKGQSDKRGLIVGWGLSVILVVVSFWLASPWKWLVLLLGGFGVLFTLGSQSKNLLKSTTNQLEEEQRNEKLMQQRQAFEELQQHYKQLKSQLAPFFKNETNPLRWRALVETYDQAATDYFATVTTYEEATHRLTELEQEYRRADTEFQLFRSWLPLENKTLLERLATLEQFQAEMNELKMQRLQQPSTLLAQQLKQIKEEQQELLVQNSALLQEIDLEHPTQLPIWFKQWEQRQKQVEKNQELTQLLQPLFPEKMTAILLATRLREVEEELAMLRFQISTIQEETQRLKLTIQHLEQDGTLDQLYQADIQQRSKIQTLVSEWTHARLTTTFLTDLATELSEQQLPQLLVVASDYFNQLTQGRYEKIFFEENQIQVSSKDEIKNVYLLSTGTKDQLMMALRFAYLTLQKGQVLCPMIIDDGWLHYDNQRKAVLAKLFKEIGEHYQVICFSSDKEMARHYQKINQPVQTMTKKGISHEKN